MFVSQLKLPMLAVLVTVTFPAQAQAQAQMEATSPFAPDSCLSAQGDARTWAAYCSEAQAIHDRLMQRSRTAPVEIKQLKSLLFERGDKQMWQFLSIGLVERSPYFSSKPRKLAMISEIEETLNPEMVADRFVAVTTESIRAFEEGDASVVPSLVDRAEALMEGQDNKHLMALLGSSMIKLAQLSARDGALDTAEKALTICEKASDAWGNPLMPQRCYNLMTLSGTEPDAFIHFIASREEALTCGRGLKPLCNLFHKTGHGRFLPAPSE